jgi:mannitol/fructose-specific phosphotransferase system IIA component
MRKEGISFGSALKVIECIAADDEEKSARIRTLGETYKKEDLDKYVDIQVYSLRL